MGEPTPDANRRPSDPPPRSRKADVPEPLVVPPIPGEYEVRPKQTDERFKKSDLSSGSE